MDLISYIMIKVQKSIVTKILFINTNIILYVSINPAVNTIFTVFIIQHCFITTT